MHIFCNINLSEDDKPAWSPEEAANAVMTALGGDPVKDTCNVQVTIPPASVGATTSPTP